MGNESGVNSIFFLFCLCKHNILSQACAVSKPNKMPDELVSDAESAAENATKKIAPKKSKKISAIKAKSKSQRAALDKQVVADRMKRVREARKSKKVAPVKKDKTSRKKK